MKRTPIVSAALVSAALVSTALVSAAIVLGSGTAFADDGRCNTPMAEWQPRETLQQQLEAEGWQVKRIKTDDGCYEVYALDRDGRRIEAYFDPKSLKMLRMEDDD